jgi:hypothetical protein
MENVKTIKKGFIFLTKPEKDKARSIPKIIEKPIINASSKLKLNLILFKFHFYDACFSRNLPICSNAEIVSGIVTSI